MRLLLRHSRTSAVSLFITTATSCRAVTSGVIRIVTRCRTSWGRLAREVVPAAVVSGATAGATAWLLTLLAHHL